MSYFEKDRQTSIAMFERPDLMDKGELVDLVYMIDFAKSYRRGHEALYQLHAKGPVWDGDVVSKNDRDVFLGIGACAKVCVQGEQGFNACTYFGRNLLRIYEWMYGALPGTEPLK